MEDLGINSILVVVVVVVVVCTTLAEEYNTKNRQHVLLM